ncbi:hypothetical protein [uncultured Cohaesibacter sp.]|uniref:hypothetical protein n=1 Tax=uncultured Cohaesibacter sp. TaxID=1002546 RepID=UPI0029C8BEC7|nr:hypothetical protein [uncultured Cohaesibacter sp.]
MTGTIRSVPTKTILDREDDGVRPKCPQTCRASEKHPIPSPTHGNPATRLLRSIALIHRTDDSVSEGLIRRNKDSENQHQKDRQAAECPPPPASSEKENHYRKEEKKNKFNGTGTFNNAIFTYKNPAFQ